MIKCYKISIGYCKKDVTPLLTHWSYVFHALTHWYMKFHIIPYIHKVCKYMYHNCWPITHQFNNMASHQMYTEWCIEWSDELFVVSQQLFLDYMYFQWRWHGHTLHITGPLWGKSPLACGFPAQKPSNAELWWFLWCKPELAVEQKVDMYVIWDAMRLVLLKCNEYMTTHTWSSSDLAWRKYSSRTCYVWPFCTECATKTKVIYMYIYNLLIPEISVNVCRFLFQTWPIRLYVAVISMDGVAEVLAVLLVH